jgi:aryl-alcohol dehydrogenase (NADP+)
MSDEGSLSAVEELIPLAESAGIPLMHMALAFVGAHPARSAAIIGPRTMDRLDGLLAGADLVLSDELLDRIDEIVPPAVDVAPLEGAACSPPSITQAGLRRGPVTERAAA